MHTKLYSEDQILDKGFRAKVLEEVVGSENQSRKLEMKRRWDVYKDKTRQHVIEALSMEFDNETVHEMRNRAANVSIAKKIVNKLARSYNGGVTRNLEDALSQEAVEKLAEELDFNTKKKKTDRYLELFKNCATHFVPKKVVRESFGELEKFCLQKRVLAPFHYDVIQDATEPDEARVLILSDIQEESPLVGLPAGSDGRNLPTNYNQKTSDNIDGIIADDDKSAECFIWWSDNYHFTTDKEGTIIEDKSPEDRMNPIGIMPTVFFSDDQEGDFWAEGGEDLIDEAISINVLLTDMYSIANVQGWGQPFISGSNIPEKLVMGPHRALKFSYNEGDPKPEFEYKSSNPPLDMHMRMIEQKISLLLTSKGLSTKFAGQVSGADAASGISKLIDESEATESVEDRQRLFKDKEPLEWEVVKRWQNLYFERKVLCEDFMGIGKFEDSNVNLKFGEVKPIITEEQKLRAMEQKKNLGIVTMLDLMKMDNPDMTDEEAEEKLRMIEEEKLARVQAFGPKFESEEDEKPSEDEDQEKDQEEEEEPMEEVE